MHNVSYGFGAGLTVTQVGMNVRFNGRSATRLIVRNTSSTKKCYVGVNQRVIGGQGSGRVTNAVFTDAAATATNVGTLVTVTTASDLTTLGIQPGDLLLVNLGAGDVREFVIVSVASASTLVIEDPGVYVFTDEALSIVRYRFSLGSDRLLQAVTVASLRTGGIEIPTSSVLELEGTRGEENPGSAIYSVAVATEDATSVTITGGTIRL